MELSCYQDIAGAWRWRAVSDNGQIIATSGESFDSKRNAIRAATNVRDSIGRAAIAIEKEETA